MIGYSRENLFLITILEKSNNFVQLSTHYKKQKQIVFFLKKVNNHQPLADNPPKSNTCSTYLSLMSSYTVHRTHKNQQANTISTSNLRN
jgi:hypothetical protein